MNCPQDMWAGVFLCHYLCLFVSQVKYLHHFDQFSEGHKSLTSCLIDNWQGPLWAVRYIAYSLNCAIPKYVCSATQVWNTFHFLCLRRAAPLHFKHTIKFSSRTLWFDPHFHYQICQQIVKLIIFGMDYIIWPFLQAASDNWLFYW